MRQFVSLAITFGILTALAFFAVPLELPRAIIVIAFSAISGISTLCLLGILLSRGIRRRQLRKSWAVAAAVVVAMEATLVSVLNSYADSRVTPATALMQDSYAEVAATISLGDAIQQGRAPSDVTFATVQARALAVWVRLSLLDVPGQLADYTSSVKDWAQDVVTASIGAQSGSPWQGVPDTPSPFQVNMTAGQATAAFGTTLSRVATLIEFGDLAVAAQNVEAIRFIGARLNAQAYWLEGIYTSADPDVVAAQLHFIEPVNSSSGGVAETGTGMRLVAGIFPRRGSWRSPRHGDVCYTRVCASRLRGPLGNLWRYENSAALACGAAGGKWNGHCTQDVNQQWGMATQPILPLIDTAGAQPIGGAGAGVASPVSVLPQPPQAFLARCTAQGGTVVSSASTGGAASVMNRLPTSEGGWICHNQGGKCWDYLTYSGNGYQGGDQGCPEQGLVPLPGGPVAGIVNQAGGFIARLIPPTPPTAPAAPSGGVAQTWQFQVKGGSVPASVDGQGNIVMQFPYGDYRDCHALEPVQGRFSGATVTLYGQGSDCGVVQTDRGSGTANAPWPSATRATGTITDSITIQGRTQTSTQQWTLIRLSP